MAFREGRLGKSGEGFVMSNIFNWAMRFLQFIAAIVVIGLYGVDLNRAHRENKYSDSKWGYAVAVGTLSGVTALALGLLGLCAKFRVVSFLFAWEWILVILWAAASGIFGSMYFNENSEGDSGISRMKTAAGFDLANLILWFISAVVGTVSFFWVEKRSLHTGRATA